MVYSVFYVDLKNLPFLAKKCSQIGVCLHFEKVAQPFTEKGSGERYFKSECMNNITFDVGSTIWLFVDFFHVDFKNLPFLAKMCSNIGVCLHYV